MSVNVLPNIGIIVRRSYQISFIDAISPHRFIVLECNTVWRASLSSSVLLLTLCFACKWPSKEIVVSKCYPSHFLFLSKRFFTDLILSESERAL